MATHIFLIFATKIGGRWSHFDEHIFQWGWTTNQKTTFIRCCQRKRIRKGTCPMVKEINLLWHEAIWLFTIIQIASTWTNCWEFQQKSFPKMFFSPITPLHLQVVFQQTSPEILWTIAIFKITSRFDDEQRRWKPRKPPGPDDSPWLEVVLKKKWQQKERVEGRILLDWWSQMGWKDISWNLEIVWRGHELGLRKSWRKSAIFLFYALLRYSFFIHICGDLRFNLMFKTVTPESALRFNANGEGSWLVIHRFGSAIEKKRFLSELEGNVFVEVGGWGVGGLLSLYGFLCIYI